VWALAGFALSSSSGQAQRPLTPIDWKQVDQGMGKPGRCSDGAYKNRAGRAATCTSPAAGVTLKPALALGSWVAFKQVSDTTVMLMGDSSCSSPKSRSVLAQLQEAGIEQTALHNHLLQESPRVMYLHIAGRGTRQSSRGGPRRAIPHRTPFGGHPPRRQ